jgi:hypothetical protein
MGISISLVLVFAVAAWVLYRYGGMKLWHALVCIAFGFYLATSSFGPQINRVISSIVAAFRNRGLWGRRRPTTEGGGQRDRQHEPLRHRPSGGSHSP